MKRSQKSGAVPRESGDEKAQQLYNSPQEESYVAVLGEIKAAKGRIEKIHNLWRKEV